MAWTNPITFTTGNVLTAAQMNTYVRDNTNFLHDPPAVKVFRTAAQNISASTETAITFATANRTKPYDTDTMHNGATNTSRITFNTAGVYSLIGGTSFVATNSTGQRRMKILLNGATDLVYAREKSPSGSNPDVCNAVTHYQAVVNDYVEMTCNQDSGVTIATNTGEDGCFFGAHWLGAG